MNKKPQFVLFSGIREQSGHDQHGGSWRFLLKSKDAGQQMEASDTEPGITRERLELLAVVRGLEALEQPSDVTLVTSSRQITRAIRADLDRWRSDGWTWERFGEKVAIKNCDLWQRVDRARSIHHINCRRLRFDAGHAGLSSPHDPAKARPARLPNRQARQWSPVRLIASLLFRLAERLDRQLRERHPHLGI
jgi:ribonuclease HI